MRKLFMVVLVLVVLTGCGGQPMVYINEGQEIEVDVGQQFVILIDSNPTMGYDWEVDYDKARLGLMMREYEPTEGQIGSGGISKFRFKAKEKGRTDITMVYKRDWEERSPDDKVRVFQVVIR